MNDPFKSFQLKSEILQIFYYLIDMYINRQIPIDLDGLAKHIAHYKS